MLKHPHLVAWLTLVAGFVTLCATLIGAASGLRWFLFASPVPLTARLVVSQGSVTLQTPNGDKVGVYDSQIIQPQTTVIVGDSMQGILSFIDPYSGDAIADFTLTTGTRLTLTAATRPRFEWSHLNYAITLSNAEGQLIVAAPAQSRALQTEIDTYAGTAWLNSDGHYTISTGQSAQGSPQLHVFNQGGEALIALPDGQPQKVWPNTVMNADRNQNFIQESDSPYKLLNNGLFDSTPVTATPSGSPSDPAVQAITQLPVGRNSATDPNGWQCTTAADAPNYPTGNWSRLSDFENGALHFWRVGSALNHAETSCTFTFNNPARPADHWLDVSNQYYSAIRLHVRFKLEAHDPSAPGLAVQDLPVCGNQGTECPVMLEIVSSNDTADPDSALEYWHHGFYALAADGYPKTCDTCRVAHDRINPDVWYYYDSGDLRLQITGKPTDPLLIKSIRVYASGHQYDVAIGEVTLLGIPNAPSAITS